VLADCLKTLSNAEKRGKRQVMLRPSSKVVIKFLQVMQKNGKKPPKFHSLGSLVVIMLFSFWIGYIGEFEVVDDHRAGKIIVELIGRLNKCGVISPRFDVGTKVRRFYLYFFMLILEVLHLIYLHL
jgi:small subunit ribosomal protein S15Ae